MRPRWVVDTPARLVEVCRLEGVVVIRKIGGVWHAGLPWGNKGRGRARAYSSWQEAMRAVPHGEMQP